MPVIRSVGLLPVSDHIDNVQLHPRAVVDRSRDCVTVSFRVADLCVVDICMSYVQINNVEYGSISKPTAIVNTSNQHGNGHENTLIRFGTAPIRRHIRTVGPLEKPNRTQYSLWSSSTLVAYVSCANSLQRSLVQARIGSQLTKQRRRKEHFCRIVADPERLIVATAYRIICLVGDCRIGARPIGRFAIGIHNDFLSECFDSAKRWRR